LSDGAKGKRERKFGRAKKLESCQTSRKEE